MSPTTCPCGGVCPCHEQKRIRESRRAPRSSEDRRDRVRLYRARASGWVCSRCGVPIRRRDGRDPKSPWVHATTGTCGQAPKPFRPDHPEAH